METDKSYIKRVKQKISYLLRVREDFRKSSQFGNWYYTFYAATNENLDYFADLGVAGKDTLTVTGSGDHALNLAYFGAKSIDTFDINELAIIAFDLKKTALLHLSRSEFIDFYTFPNFMDKKIYNKIYPYLSDVTKVVFDIIFKNMVNDRSFERVIEEYENVNKNLNFNNPYLSSEQAYLETRRRLQSLNNPMENKVCPAHKLGEFFDQKDIVILSNIIHYYMQNSYLMNSELNFSSDKKVDEFVKSLKNTLSDDGLVSLLYKKYKSFGGRSPTKTEDELKLYFNIKGNIKVVEDKVNSTSDLVFLARKEDFPEFER